MLKPSFFHSNCVGGGMGSGGMGSGGRGNDNRDEDEECALRRQIEEHHRQLEQLAREVGVERKNSGIYPDEKTENMKLNKIGFCVLCSYQIMCLFGPCPMVVKKSV